MCTLHYAPLEIRSHVQDPPVRSRIRASHSYYLQHALPVNRDSIHNKLVPRSQWRVHHSDTELVIFCYQLRDHATA